MFGYETLELAVPTLPPGVLINDPKNLDFIFKNEGLFSKGEFVKQRSWDLFGKERLDLLLRRSQNIRTNVRRLIL
jgi:hypothetical protein